MPDWRECWRCRPKVKSGTSAYRINVRYRFSGRQKLPVGKRPQSRQTAMRLIAAVETSFEIPREQTSMTMTLGGVLAPWQPPSSAWLQSDEAGRVEVHHVRLPALSLEGPILWAP